MQYKVVIFDLFETLITEWGHKKYTKNEMCADVGIERERFDKFWNEKEDDRYLGNISFKDSLLYVCKKCEKSIADSTLTAVIEKRITTKAACFDGVLPDVFRLLRTLKDMGIKTAIISNCSYEEVKALQESELYLLFDETVLSYEVNMKKPDRSIYEETSKRLGVDPAECIFVGDGGSNELAGAKAVGMKAVQAKWYTNRYPQKRDSIEGFGVAEEPLDVLKYL